MKYTNPLLLSVEAGVSDEPANRSYLFPFCSSSLVGVLEPDPERLLLPPLAPLDHAPGRPPGPKEISPESFF